MRRSQYFELEVHINSLKLSYYVEKEYSQHVLIIMYVQYPTGHWWRNGDVVIDSLYFRLFYFGFPYFWSECRFLEVCFSLWRLYNLFSIRFWSSLIFKKLCKDPTRVEHLYFNEPFMVLIELYFIVFFFFLRGTSKVKLPVPLSKPSSAFFRNAFEPFSFQSDILSKPF